jgi:hypothetical protein
MAIAHWIGVIRGGAKTLSELDRRLGELEAALKDMGDAGIVPTRETIARAQVRLADSRKAQAARAKERRARLK